MEIMSTTTAKGSAVVLLANWDMLGGSALTWPRLKRGTCLSVRTALCWRYASTESRMGVLNVTRIVECSGGGETWALEPTKEMLE